MKMTIAMKVVGVYVVIVIGSLALDGLLTNRAIEAYVIRTTRANLVREGNRVIGNFEQYGSHLRDRRPGSGSTVSVAAQKVPGEYIVVSPSGSILWNTFSKADEPLLSHIGQVVGKALNGRVATGVYPQSNPVFEFVAIPFKYTSDVPRLTDLPSDMRSVPLSIPNIPPRSNRKVVALFARVSDIQRIASQIWLAVAQGLAIASLISAVVGALLARWLMRPIRQLRTAIERVRERDFSAVPVIHTRDEWRDLAEAFGDMMLSLRAFDEGQKRFLQNASHELKTPLMAIRGYAEGLRDGVFERSETFRILDIIAQESVRLKALVDELIYLSKLETLDEVYTFMQQDLASMIYQTIERLHPLAREREINILVDVPDQPVISLVDKDKMVQAFLNIVANAVRHARRQVFLRLEAAEHARIIVEDDGDGFQEGDRERVFERFFHGAKGDTGLGLPIARAIIEKHRGQIYAENASAGGARFVIVLPL